MSDDTSNAPAAEPKGGSDQDAPEPAAEDKKFSQADLDRIIAGRLSKYADYDELKSQVQGLQDAAATDTERAVNQARREAETAAAQTFGARLARTEFDALAGRRNPDFDTQQALEYVDLTKFIGEGGEPDRDAIKAAVERLVPAPASGPPSFDGGVRTAPSSADFNQELRRAAGRA